MTTFVTGGTGFIGGAVVRELALSGEPVRAICRQGVPRDPELAALPVEWVDGDLLDPTTLRFAMEGCDRVYHCAGRLSTHPNDAQLVHDVNVQGTINLLETALTLRVRRVVMTASIFALGIAAKGQPLADETVAYNLEHLRSPYVRSKREVEIATPGFIERGLDIVSVYPGFCAGPGDHYVTSSRLIVAYLRHLLPGYPSGGLCQVDVRDAAHAHILAMAYGKPGERYLVPGHNVTYKEIFTALAKVTGRHPPQLEIPLFLLGPAGAILERFSRKPLLDSGTAQILQQTWWYDDAKARRDLGIEYRPLENTLADAVYWFAAQSLVPRRYTRRILTMYSAEG